MTLEEVVAGIRLMLVDSSRPTKERVRLLWASAKKVREIAAADVINRTFTSLAIETKLINGRDRWAGADVADHVRPYGAEDIAHVIAWALLGRNPFEKGPLK
jgi:hypothetical protein